MPILGIDYDKCIDCMECVKDCPVFLYLKDEEGKVMYNDPKKNCILCGHCIAVCPTEAILYNEAGESSTFDGIKNPSSLLDYESLLHFFQLLLNIQKLPDSIFPG